jgi:FkbM family methyltransferase
MKSFFCETQAILRNIPFYSPNEFDNKFLGEPDCRIYGAGFLGTHFADELARAGKEVRGFFETTVKSPICGHTGLSIRAPYPPRAADSNAVVIISSFTYCDAMFKTLSDLGYRAEQIITPVGFFEKFYLPRFRDAYDAFRDDLSKQTVLDKILYLISGKPMNPVSPYFVYEIFGGLSDHEVFVDGGAADGSTVLEFCRITGGNYKRIVCFEPAKLTFDLLQTTVKNLENVETVNKALYSRNAILKFKDYGIDEWNAVDNYFMGHNWNGPDKAYRISEIQATTLDDFFADVPVADCPTVIKLDIEGSEKEAILGMKRVLRLAHPKLVICAYHKIEDYYELVRAINDVCPGYSLKLRHFTETVFDSVIYGVYDGNTGMRSTMEI